MHRVELKVEWFVEASQVAAGFLMHRVELKACKHQSQKELTQMFLMHRVELKENFSLLFWEEAVDYVCS